MTVAKARLQEMMDALPEEIEVEEVMYRLYLLEKIEAAEGDIRAGRVISQEEAEREAAAWRK
jgi:hypothetical protein